MKKGMFDPHFVGKFRGRGEWRDSAGGKGGYQVEHEILPTESGLTIRYTHIFDNDDPDVTASLELSEIAPCIYTVALGGNPVGHGYFLAGLLHFSIQAGDVQVETGCRSSEAGLSVWGSSNRNAAGNFIAWQENLTRG